MKEHGMGVRAVVFAPVDGRVIVIEPASRGGNYLVMRAKQLNGITLGNNYKVIDLNDGEYVDGYGRKNIVDDGTIRVVC